MHKKVVVILFGCGVYGGTGIHENVIVLLRLSQRDAGAQCFAPNIAQHHVVNRLTGEEMSGGHNVLVESARIVRGEVKNLRETRAEDYDALIMPGGLDATKNLSDFAINGAQCQVQSDMLVLAKAFAEADEPVGLICIAPAMAAETYGADAQCTIGNDADTIDPLKRMSAEHVDAPVDEIVEDSTRKLVATPAHMLVQSIAEAAPGINKLVGQVLELTDQDRARSAKHEGGRVAALFKPVPLRQRASRNRRVEAPR